MPETLITIGTAIADLSLKVGAFVGNTLIAVGVPANIAASIATGTVYAVDALIYAAPSLILAGVRPGPPAPQELRIPLKQPRPVRQTGTGIDRIAGPYMLFESEGQNSYDVFAIHDGKVQSYDQWWLNDDQVTLDGSGWVQDIGQKYKNNRVRLIWRYGEATETAYSELVSALPSVWTTAHRGDGIASLYMLSVAPTAENFPSRFPNGLPLPSVTAKLSLVYDPRDPAQDPDDSSTWEWSKNAALNLLFYLCFTDGGPRIPYERHILPTIAYWKRAADVCDEAVPLAAGGTTPRYEQGGTWTWDTAPSAVIGQFLDCMDGWMCRNADGCLVLKAGKYDVPAVTLTDEDVYGFTINRFQPAERAVNELVVSYKSADHDFNVVQTDSWRNEDDIERIGEVKSRSISLPWVQNNSQARRLAKRAMSRQGADTTGTITVDLFDAYESELITDRYIRVQLGENQPRTLQDIVIEVTGAENDIMSSLTTLSWIKADQDIDSWVAATEEGGGPSGTVSSPTTNTEALNIISADFDGSPEKLVVTVTDPARADIVDYYIRYRASGTLTWVEQIATVTDIGAQLELRSTAVEPGDWEVQVWYLTDVFAYGDYANDPPDVVTI